MTTKDRKQYTQYIMGVVDKIKENYHYRMYLGMLGKSRHTANLDDDDGSWITVNGTPVHLNNSGAIDKGPAGVKNNFSSSKATPKQQKAMNYKVEKKGKTFFARNENGFAITSGSSKEEVEANAQKKVEQFGPTLGMKSGDKETFSTDLVSKDGLKQLIKNAGDGSTAKTAKGEIYTKEGTSWTGKSSSFYLGGSKRPTTVSSDTLQSKGIVEMTYIKK